MRRLFLTFLLLSSTHSALAESLDFSQCAFPETAPEIPIGSEATQTDMAAASAAVRTYASEMQDGLACIDAIGNQLDENATEETRLSVNNAYNAKYDEMLEIVESFNAEIRAFRAK